MAVGLREVAMTAGVIVAASIPLMAQGGSARPATGPRLEFAEKDHDVGRLGPKAPFPPIDVAIRNTGDQPLDIGTIRTSCPCLTATLSTARIAPGGDATLRLQMTLSGIDEDIEEQVVVYSNDPAQPVVTYNLSGSVGTVIQILPEGIPLGVSYRGDVERLEFPPVRLVAADHAPIGQIRLTASQPYIRPEARKLDDGSYQVGITLAPSVPLGRINEWIRVETEHPTVRSLDIPVIGAIVGELDPAGRGIDMGFFKEKQPASARFLLRRRGERDIEILGAEAKLPVPADVRVTREGSDFNIEVRVASAPAFTLLAPGYVELRTNNPSEPIVRVPVFGGALAEHPFEQAAAGEADARFMAVVKDVLARGDGIPADRFYSDVLGGVKDDRAIAVLLRAAAEADLAARMRAVELLAAFKTPVVLGRLRSLITDDVHEFVRRLALVGYVEAVGKAALPEMLMALKDNEGWVREDAAIYLGRFGDASVIPALRAASADPDPDANDAVRNALSALQASAAR